MSSSLASFYRVHSLSRLFPCASYSALVFSSRRYLLTPAPSTDAALNIPSDAVTPPLVIPSDAASPQMAARPPPAPRPERSRPKIRSTRAALSITPRAVERLQGLLRGPHPQLIRIGVRNKGCAGLSYHLEYVETPGKFDEVVEQNGVRVLIDSKALFSIIGSEMDWQEDPLSARFAFKNPNIKDACGCGESFTVGSSSSPLL